MADIVFIISQRSRCEINFDSHRFQAELQLPPNSCSFLKIIIIKYRFIFFLKERASLIFHLFIIFDIDDRLLKMKQKKKDKNLLCSLMVRPPVANSVCNRLFLFWRGFQQNRTGGRMTIIEFFFPQLLLFICCFDMVKFG